jgi:cytochrome c oxidase subunit 2
MNMDRSRRLVWMAAVSAVLSTLMNRLGAQSAPVPVAVASGGREIAIEARRFAFSPNRIALKAQQPVVLAFTAIDFMHGFNVPDLHLRHDLLPGRVVRVPLRFDKPGEYDFLCDNFCGDGHEGMNGKFIVTA